MKNKISAQSFIKLGEYIYKRDIALSNYKLAKTQFEKQLLKLNEEFSALDNDINDINVILTQLKLSLNTHVKQFKNSFYIFKLRPDTTTQLQIQKSITYNKRILTQKLREQQMCFEMLTIVNKSIDELPSIT
jgi:5-formyltetrahydrofolate cyclo-ligase